MRLFLGLCALLFLNGWGRPAHAVPAKDTSTSGSWNTGTNWTPAGVPVAGPGGSVNLDLGMTVNTSTSFGDGAENSLWPVAGVLTVNSGQQLEHVATSTFVISNANPFFAGSGTFLNSGTIQNLSPRLLYLSNGTTFSNAGLFQFMGTNSQLVMHDVSTPKFINSGGIQVNMTAATDIARFGSENRIGGGVFTQLGSPITFTNGVFVFGPPGGIGGTMTDAAFAAHFGAIGGTSELRLAGGVDLQLDSTVTDLSRVWLGESSVNVQPKPGNTPTVLNVTGAGIRTSVGNPKIFTGAALDSIVNQGTIVVANNGGQFWIEGNGAFNNQGTLRLESNRFLIGVSGDPTINNSGTIRFTQNNARIELWSGTPIINNNPGGQLVIDLPNATDTAFLSAENNSLNNGYTGQYRHMGGNAVQFIQGNFVFAPPGGINAPLTDSLFASMFGPINGNSMLILSGGISNITLNSSDVSRVRLGNSGQQYVAPAGGSVLNVTAAGGLRTANGAPVANAAAGRTITNNGTLVISSGHQFWFNGDGTLLNNGSLTVENNRFLLGVSGNPTFNNSGTILLNENNSRIQLFGTTAANSFNNLANGVVRVNLGLGTQSSEIGREGGSGGTFTNLGTIEILRGELVVESLITNTTAVTGGGTILDTGNWRVLANGQRSRLNLQVGGTGIGGVAPFDGTITSISAAAGLVLSNQAGGTVEFPQLGALQTVAGELFVHGSMNLPVAAAMNVTGSLGGDGFVTSPGTITLNGGVLDPATLTGGPGTLTINGNLALTSTTLLSYSLDTPGIVGSNVNDLVVVNGDLTLDGVLDITDLGNLGTGTYRLFNYTGTLFNNGLTLAYANYSLDVSTFGQVNLSILPVPEPSTGLLLVAGLLGLRRRKRSS